MRLDKAIDLFLGELRPTTAESYRYVLYNMRDWVGAARPVDSIAPEQLIEYSQQVRSRDYKPATVHKYIKTTKIFFNWLVKIGALEKSPAKAVRAPRLQKYISRDKAMTDGELEKILDYVKWKPRDYALILFLADTGCRAGGASKLTVDDLDIQNRRAVVTEKGDKTRPVIYGPRCAEAILVWLMKRPKRAGVYVFSRTQNPLSPHNISQVIRRACKTVGIRTLSAHSLRHRKGHQLADNHVAVSIAATALGHESVETTLNHYYPADWATAEKELRKLAIQSEETPKIIRFRSRP